MAASTGAARPLGQRRDGEARRTAWAALCGQASLVLLCGLPLCAVMLAVRRFSLDAQPLHPALLPPVALLSVSVAWVARRLAAISPPGPRGAVARAAPLLATSTSLLVLGLAIGAGGRPWWAALAFWAIAALEEAWAWRSCLAEPNGSRFRFAENSFRRSSETDPHRPLVLPPPVSARRQVSAHHRLTQEYTRASLEGGEERIQGALHLLVRAGARTATAHVAFCPPFAARPQFETRLTSGPPCRLKVGQLLPQGARIEIKLHATLAVDQTLSLEFTADGQELPPSEEPA